MPSNLEVLINTELVTVSFKIEWDLRTLNLLKKASCLNDVAIKRTFNDNILFGESIRDDYHIYGSEDHLYNWEKFHSLLGEYIELYNSKDLSKLSYLKIFLNIVKKDFKSNLMFANISTNCTKL
ncbi:hypothetical protein MXB_2086, partial [Myxobolus squamalis]